MSSTVAGGGRTRQSERIPRMAKKDVSPTGVVDDDEMAWHPLRESDEEDHTKKYRCGRCGEPKQGHICKMVVLTQAVGIQSDPSKPILGQGAKTLTVSRGRKSRPNSSGSRHRRLLSDPFPLSASVDMLDFGLPDFELINDPAIDKIDLLDDLFSAELVVDDDLSPPPPPPSDRSPRTPFFQTSPPAPKPSAKKKGHRRTHSAPSPDTLHFMMPPLHPVLPRILDDDEIQYQ